MYVSENVWPLVLAAGEGSRLRGLTMTSGGVHVPKQFCSLQGGPSFLQETLRRARSMAPAERICAVVAAQHRRWWQGHSGGMPDANWIVQPENRGTANGILLGLLQILQRSPEATVVILPSDHHFSDEPTLRQSLRAAIGRLVIRPREILLLGLEADAPDPELGYIVPESVDLEGVFSIVDFVEKPEPERAAALIDRGALWNSLIIAAQGKVLLTLIERQFPRVVRDMRHAVRHINKTPGNSLALDVLYHRLPRLDFSRNILQDALAEDLRVLAVPSCGWSDLGTPERVVEVLRRTRGAGQSTVARGEEPAHINLAVAHEANVRFQSESVCAAPSAG